MRLSLCNSYDIHCIYNGYLGRFYQMANGSAQERDDTRGAVLLQTPSDLLAEFDSTRGRSLIKKNRAACVLEAIFEKVLREKHGTRNGSNGKK